MNKERRKRIKAIIDKLQDIDTEIEELVDEELDALDNMPEAMQVGPRGEAIQNAVDVLTEAQNSVESAIYNLQSSIE